jgi:predicted  nucleic acid-binding Zn-ribbon protein
LAAKGTSQNGHGRLEEAMAVLIQNQAAFVGHIADNDRRHLEFERESSERVARIEAKMAEIIRVLSEHGRQLERLTEAVRDKIGFKS